MSDKFQLLSVIPRDVMRVIMPYLSWKEQRLLVRLRVPHLTRYIKTCWLRGLLKANLFHIANTFGSPFHGLLVECKKSRLCKWESSTRHTKSFIITRQMDLVNTLKFIGYDKPNNIKLKANGMIIAETNIIDKDGIIRFPNLDKLWLFITIIPYSCITLILTYTNPPTRQPFIYFRGFEIANRLAYCSNVHEIPWNNNILIYTGGCLGLKSIG